MNIQPDIQNDHNADKRFKSFDAKLADINTAILKAQKFQSSYNTAIFKAICITLDLGYDFAKQHEIDKNETDEDWRLLKNFLTYHDERWSSKCETNIFHGLVTIAFNQIGVDGKEISTAPTLSKYRAILRFAFDNGISSSNLLDRLEEKTLNTVYGEAISQFRFDPIDNYIEDVDERYKRASQVLTAKTNLPSAKFTTSIPKPDIKGKFASAIVKINGNSFDILGFAENEAEEQIKAKVIDLVPAEARYARRKLTDKNLYQLYACCDLYKRFTPNMATIKAWEKAHLDASLPVLTQNATQEEFEVYILKQRALKAAHNAAVSGLKDKLIHSKMPDSVVNKYMLLNALEFDIQDEKLLAFSLSTHPSTPCWDFGFAQEGFDLNGPFPLMLKDVDAKSFSNDYLEEGEWVLERNGTGYEVSPVKDPSLDKDPLLQIHIQNYTTLGDWRKLDTDLNSVGRYKLDKIQLDLLSHWKDEYSQLPTMMHKSFQANMNIEVNTGIVDLVLPNNDTERRTLGTLLTPNASTNNTPTSYKKRLFSFGDITKLIQLALDYRIHYEFELLVGHQGLSAIRFHCIGLPFEASITIPTLLSVKGNPVEITVE